MKKVILLMFLVISFFATVNYAKPVYCLTALENCFDWCEANYDWYEYPMRAGCKTGCAIGYIAC